MTNNFRKILDDNLSKLNEEKKQYALDYLNKRNHYREYMKDLYDYGGSVSDKDYYKVTEKYNREISKLQNKYKPIGKYIMKLYNEIENLNKKINPNLKSDELDRIQKEIKTRHDLIIQWRDKVNDDLEKINKEAIDNSSIAIEDTLYDIEGFLKSINVEKSDEIAVLTEEADKAREARLAAKQVTIAAEKFSKNPNAHTQSALMANKSAAVTANKEYREKDIKDAVSGEPLKEESLYEDAEENIQRQIDFKEKTLAKTIDNNNKKVERIKDQIKRLKATAENIKQSTNDGSTAQTEEQTANTLTEEDLRLKMMGGKTAEDKIDDVTVSKDLKKDPEINKSLDINKELALKKYDTMLFNGQGGEALRYLIKGEITNKNSSEIEIVKKIKDDKDVLIIIKKLNSYIKKAAAGKLTYEMYTDMKVQKSEFKKIFTKAKHDYENRFKIKGN